MTSYPKPTPTWAVGCARSIARAYEGKLSAVVLQRHIRNVPNALADALVGANKIVVAENRKSRAQARSLLATFEQLVPVQERGETYLIDCGPVLMGNEFAGLARVSDLTILPIHPESEARSLAEELVFASGRPLVLLPPTELRDERFRKIVIGWDGGRAAARALGDALLFLERGSGIFLAHVSEDRSVEADRKLRAAVRHLETHGIRAESIRECPDPDTGATLLRVCEQVGADLLVIGAFGHSRLREFIVGGVTRTVIASAQLPVLLSH